MLQVRKACGSNPCFSPEGQEALRVPEQQAHCEGTASTTPRFLPELGKEMQGTTPVYLNPPPDLTHREAIDWILYDSSKYPGRVGTMRDDVHVIAKNGETPFEVWSLLHRERVRRSKRRTRQA